LKFNLLSHHKHCINQQNILVAVACDVESFVMPSFPAIALNGQQGHAT